MCQHSHLASPLVDKILQFFDFPRFFLWFFFVFWSNILMNWNCFYLLCMKKCPHKYFLIFPYFPFSCHVLLIILSLRTVPLSNTNIPWLGFLNLSTEFYCIFF